MGGKKKFRPVPKEMLGNSDQLAAIFSGTSDENGGQYRSSNDRSHDGYNRRRNDGGQYNQGSRNNSKPGEESSSSDQWRSSMNERFHNNERSSNSSNWRSSEGQGSSTYSRSVRDSSRNQRAAPRDSFNEEGNSNWRSDEGSQKYQPPRGETRRTWMPSRDRTADGNSYPRRTDYNSERTNTSTTEKAWRTASNNDAAPTRTNEEADVSHPAPEENLADDQMDIKQSVEENESFNISVTEEIDPSKNSSDNWLETTMDESEAYNMNNSIDSSTYTEHKPYGDKLRRSHNNRSSNENHSSQDKLKQDKGRNKYPQRKKSLDNSDKRDSSVYSLSQNIFFQNLSEEQESFIHYLKSKEAASFNKVEEVDSDLFDAGDEYALAHCVAEDMNMGSGIAIEFRQRFKKVQELLDQRAQTGGLAILEIKDRFIYYLVTKTKSNGKPNYNTLWSSLLKLRSHMRENKVTKLAIPRIGCGLDRLNWDYVKPMLEFLFMKEDVKILVCNHQPDGSVPRSVNKCKVVFDPKPIIEIDPETVIIYFASKDGKPSEEMILLDKKFKFLSNFGSVPKDVGETVRTVPPFQKSYVLYGCIVKNKHDDPFGFVHFSSCLHKIRKNYKSDNYYYIAFQSLGDDLLNAKILNLMKHTLKEIEIYICGCPTNPVED